MFKRQIIEAHHHLSLEHPGHYWDEFSWNYDRLTSTEGEKMEMDIRATEGKRLRY
ncbi:MAG: hypothetical protein HQ475_00410 [SAR202 cluster bacterium]|nr:hypothetical protein [SAR202 cluster bacterium]